MVDEHIPLARDPFFTVFQKAQKNGSQLVQDLFHPQHVCKSSLEKFAVKTSGEDLILQRGRGSCDSGMALMGKPSIFSGYNLNIAKNDYILCFWFM